MKSKDNAAIVIPFGKHKGKTVAELLARDPSYAEWITNQNWVAERFAELHAAILTRGANPDDSPEHNAIQARFLDEEFAVAAVMAAWPGRVEEIWNNHLHWLDHATRFDTDRAQAKAVYEQALLKRPRLRTRVQFELSGIDAVIHIGFGYQPSQNEPGVLASAIEIKPALGDDFPSVMRQMARLRATTLVVGSYTGSAVPEPVLRQMFAANGISMISVRDIEAELPNARVEIGS